MGNCGSKRNQGKPPNIKSPKGGNDKLNNKGVFQPLKKDKDSKPKPYDRQTPTLFEKGEEKLLF